MLDWFVYKVKELLIFSVKLVVKDKRIIFLQTLSNYVLEISENLFIEKIYHEMDQNVIFVKCSNNSRKMLQFSVKMHIKWNYATWFHEKNTTTYFEMRTKSFIFLRNFVKMAIFFCFVNFYMNRVQMILFSLDSFVPKCTYSCRAVC